MSEISEPSLDLQERDMVKALRNLIADIEKGSVIVTFLNIRTILDCQERGHARLSVMLKASRIGCTFSRPSRPLNPVDQTP